jgi:Zn finger protein HypA/HybF involved in hydrogenase expression
MARIDPDIAISIMKKAGLNPLEDFRGGDYPWKCECVTCGRMVSPRFRHVRDRNSGCRYCSGNSSIASEVVEEMKSYGLNPIENYPGALKKWKCVCLTCNQEVSPRIADIRMGHSGCIHCSRVSQGINRRLSSDEAKMANVMSVMREAKLEPLEDFKLSNAKWKCKCLGCESIVYPSYSSIQSGYGGCKKCGRKKIGDKSRLDQMVAIRRMKAANWEPVEPYVSSNKPWKCRCLDCGNISSPTYAHIQQGRKGCKTCGIVKHANARRMPQEDATKIANDSGFIPLEPYKGRHYPWKCECMKCHQVVHPYLAGMLDGNGCLNCSGLVINPKEARALMIKNNIEPLIDYPGAGVPWKSRCLKCQKEVYPRYSSIKMNIGGCKYCASHGYDFNSPGILYLLTNLELESHKIGITNINAKEKRLEKHSKEGWIVYETWIFENGNNAFEVEQKLLNWIREDLRLPIHLSKKQMPQGGFTETVNAMEIDLSEITNKAVEFAQSVRGSNNFADLKTSMPRKKKSD